jgi:hypothetical protein
VISGDIVDQCAAVRAAGAPASAEPMAWLAILRGVASCLETGELQQRHIVLRGPSRPQVIMKYIFTRLGVREDRIDLTEVPGAPSCLDGECDPSEMRVDVGLSDASVSEKQEKPGSAKPGSEKAQKAGSKP